MLSQNKVDSISNKVYFEQFSILLLDSCKLQKISLTFRSLWIDR